MKNMNLLEGMEQFQHDEEARRAETGSECTRHADEGLHDTCWLGRRGPGLEATRTVTWIALK